MRIIFIIILRMVKINHKGGFLICYICLLFVFAGCEQETVVDAREHESFQRLSELRILSWSDYISPKVIEGFEAQFDKKIVIREYENTAELISICEAENHRFDIVIGPSYVMADLRESMQVAKFDFDKIRGEELLDSKFRFHPWDLSGAYSIPYFSGSTIVAYRSDKIDPQEESFELLFDSNVRGRTAILSDHPERFALAHLLRGVDVGNFDESELTLSSKILKFYVNDCAGRFLDDKSIREGLLSGEIWAAHCYNRDSVKLAQLDPAIKYFTPKEGAVLWLDVLALPTESRNPDTAYLFINYILKPEIAAENANAICQQSPNLMALDLMESHLKSDPDLFLSEDVLSRCSYLTAFSDRANRLMSELSREINEK